jgi:hypothetical protein
VALTIQWVEMREKPLSLRALQETDRVASLLLYRYPLHSLVERQGSVGPHNPIWVCCGLFVLEETVRWVCASAPARCIP